MDAKLYKALRNGKALIIYTKKDGTKRKAIGTLNDEIIAKRNRGVTVGQLMDAVARNTYYDLEMNGWRRIYADAELVG